jgi:hypothetical protein
VAATEPTKGPRFLRVSGACATCDAWSFDVFDTENGCYGVPGLALPAHYEGEADHPVVITGAPLSRTMTEFKEKQP